ncbi:DUF1207 domain-containing protein [Roseisolibacter sp. H3M3-2]|uniref:DUF1207 domain-containing protein n=1 Tax=Roseisolibacter sp. H3M3-2 TaxID=3031323 RepID=UPI0023DB088E|nr:DUF1207 domain-containing protein [Roseisolibacter sp. H3M3-2]MDF1504681.1 DUF1207 domain-containing protein [Roseisolibacter sp. H3M3-2]
MRRVALALLLACAAPAAAQELAPAVRCGVAAPTPTRGYEPIPSGDVFCPLLADPKGQRSFVSYLRGNDDEVARDVASVGIADQFGLFRVNGARPGDGVQLSLAGSVFAQFDLGRSSYDLVNADYVIGLPLTVRRGGFSARARVYHQSSHLGDEFLLRGDPEDRVERENLSFESAELLLSQDAGPVRVYGGGEYYFNREPASLGRSIAHGGLELRPSAAARFGSAARARFVAGVDLKSVAEQDWRTAVSARAGIEVGRPRDDGGRARRWSLLGEFYDGPSPYGQFHARDVRLAGLGFHFVL